MHENERPLEVGDGFEFGRAHTFKNVMFKSVTQKKATDVCKAKTYLSRQYLIANVHHISKNWQGEEIGWFSIPVGDCRHKCYLSYYHCVFLPVAEVRRLFLKYQVDPTKPSTGLPSGGMTRHLFSNGSLYLFIKFYSVITTALGRLPLILSIDVQNSSLARIVDYTILPHQSLDWTWTIFFLSNSNSLPPFRPFEQDWSWIFARVLSSSATFRPFFSCLFLHSASCNFTRTSIYRGSFINSGSCWKQDEYFFRTGCFSSFFHLFNLKT